MLLALFTIGPTHAIVHFDSENSKAVVPLKKIKFNDSEVPNVGNSYSVKWTDKKTYLATVEALGINHFVHSTYEIINQALYRICW